jgi:hypothetical protein
MLLMCKSVMIFTDQISRGLKVCLQSIGMSECCKVAMCRLPREFPHGTMASLERSE